MTDIDVIDQWLSESGGREIQFIRSYSERRFVCRMVTPGATTGRSLEIFSDCTTVAHARSCAADAIQKGRV